MMGWGEGVRNGNGKNREFYHRALNDRPAAVSDESAAPLEC